MERPRLYLNHIPMLDWLVALEFGRVDEGQPPGNWVPPTRACEQLGFLRDGGDRVLGFKVLEYSAFDPEAEPAVFDGPRFDVPVLGLADVSAGEIVLAARALFGSEPSINRVYFEEAIGATGREALALWLGCLQAGDAMAHYGLGYTLHAAGRHTEAYRHLRHYTEISPCNPWAWRWLGVAADAIGETVEARAAYTRAVELDEDDETDASELLDGLR